MLPVLTADQATSAQNMSLFTDQVCVWESRCLHVQRHSSNSPENQTYFISSRNDPVQIKVKTNSFSFENTKNLEYWYFLPWLNAPECSFNILGAFISSPCDSLVCTGGVLIGWSSGRVRFGWCRSRRAWCSGPSAVMGWAEWVRGEGSGSADLWQWIWAAQSSGRRDQPPAVRRSWGRGPPAENKEKVVTNRKYWSSFVSYQVSWLEILPIY